MLLALLFVLQFKRGAVEGVAILGLRVVADLLMILGAFNVQFLRRVQ